MTDVTIRGIDEETYRHFSAEARNRGLNIGKLVTIAMNNLLEAKSMEYYEIKNITEEITVSKKDLESLDKPIKFKNMSKLKFTDDVDGPTFIHRVEKIESIKQLYLPEKLTKLQILTKLKNVDNIFQDNKIIKVP